MKLTTINTGFFKLDGGAMFGVVPKQLWQNLNPPDEKNLCTWAMRCLLIETGKRKILVDTGLGDKQGEKFRTHFQPHGEENLLRSLLEEGIQPEEITDVFLTHLHFDHCGGAVKKDPIGHLVPTFPDAIYWSNEVHWKWAMHPNPREEYSFLKENFVPLQESGVLQFIDVQGDKVEWLPGIQVQFVYGHTEAMMLLHIDWGDKKLVYCADLIPSSWHISLPYVMSYDVRPLATMREKTFLLEKAVENSWLLFFEHAPQVECANVVRNEKGRIVLEKSFSLKDLT